MKKSKIALFVVLFLVVLFNLTVAYMDRNMKERKHEDVYESCHKIWSARGLYNNHAQQNTLTSMKRAFAQGTMGAEVDLFYDVKMHKFIITHAGPTKGKNGELKYIEKEGEVLTLEKFLRVLGKDHYFWLDYKNHGRLNKKESFEAIARLEEITKGTSMKERLYIEGSNPILLSLYTDAGFKTIFGIHPHAEDNIFSSIVLNAYKIGYFFYNITAVAMPYGSIEKPIYADKAEKILKDIPVFLFHVPDDETLLNSLIRRKEVRVLLAGRDISTDRSSINLCENNISK